MSRKPKIVVPGERLFPANDEYKAGDGTYITHGHIYSSLAGVVHVTSAEQTSDGECKTVTVRRGDTQRSLIPFIGAIVTAKVTSITSRYCKCSILAVEKNALTHQFTGQIRKEDIRATEKDKTQVHLCYRPGDTILARVIAFGDSNTSFLASFIFKIETIC